VLRRPALLDVLNPHCGAIRAANVDTVVLNCTNHAFVEASIRKLLGAQMTVIDTSSVVA